LTAVRNSVGGRLTVLPLLPQARKLSSSVEASAVRVTEVKFQGVPPSEGVDIFVEAAMLAFGSLLK
jgi:hypothetical protein